MTFRLALLLVTFVDLDSYMYIVVLGRRYCTSWRIFTWKTLSDTTHDSIFAVLWPLEVL